MKVFTACLARAAALSLLLAPAPALAAAPAGRYTASGGVVKDNKTGLYWQQVVTPTVYNFASAMTYCTGNVPGLPGTGWRLPAIKELQTLVDDSIGSLPTIDASAFPATPLGGFWSSTPSASLGSSTVWGVSFVNGLSGGNQDKGYMNNVRCVR